MTKHIGKLTEFYTIYATLKQSVMSKKQMLMSILVKLGNVPTTTHDTLLRTKAENWKSLEQELD